MNSIWSVRTLLLAAILVAPLTAVAQDKEPPKDPVAAYRINIMKSLQANAGALGAILQGKVQGDDDNIALHAEAISVSARAALKAFQPKDPDEETKAAIWDNWNDFSERLKTLDTAAAEVAKIAHDQGPAAAKAKVAAMLTCKSCHDTYRNNK